MACFLRQSTLAIVKIGPFVDSGDGNTIESGLTITQPDIRLAKNGSNWAQKSAAQTLTHEENGWYEVDLSTTDTDTLGILIVVVHESGALQAWREFMVVTANVYDSLFSTDLLQVDLSQWLGGTPNMMTSGRVDSVVGSMGTGVISAGAINAGAITATAFAANAISDAAVATDMDQYAAKVWVIKESTTADHYAVAFYKNGQRVTSGVTSPTIQVIKGSDGTDLIASTSLTEIGSTHRFKKDESTNKLVAGQVYFAVVSATIDGSTRSWDQQIGRDSA